MTTTHELATAFCRYCQKSYPLRQMRVVQACSGVRMQRCIDCNARVRQAKKQAKPRRIG